MKKKKINLLNLEVKSFITTIEDPAAKTLKGGTKLNSNYPTMPCNCSAVDACLTALTTG